MKRLMSIGAAVLGLATANPAFAQHVTPAGASFSASGPARLNTTNCTLTLTGQIDSTGSGGTITGGSNAVPCQAITIDSGATFTIDSYSSGVASATLNGLVVRVNMMPACVQTSPITFSITNSGTGSTIGLSGMVGGCSVAANLAAPTVQAAP